MNYELLEQETVDRIAAYVPAGVEVVPFPENNAEMVKPFESAHISVLYRGSKFSDPISTAQITQTETNQIEVVLRSRFLRGADHSCYQLLKAIRKALIGWQASDCDRMYAAKSELVIPSTEEPGDIFTYILSFENTTFAVEDWEETTGDGADISNIQIDLSGDL